MAGDRVLKAIVITVLITNCLDGPISPVVFPVIARESFGGPETLGLMLGTFGGAAFAGALAYGAIGHRLPRRDVFVGCFFTWSLVLLVLATLPSLPVTLAALAVGGFAAGPINPVLGAVSYERIPVRLRGRVFGADHRRRVGGDPARDRARRARRGGVRRPGDTLRDRSRIRRRDELRVLQRRLPGDGSGGRARRTDRVASIARVHARGIHHLGVAVADLDEAVATYTRLFGAEVERRATVEEQGVEAAVVLVGDGRVELLAALGDDTAVGRFLAKRGPGMHHVAYEVADIDAAIVELAENGAELIDAEPREGIFGLEVAFVHPDSVHGVLSEVVSRG